MKALILNSGMGSRMGVITSEHPKCMTEIYANETILSHQLKQLVDIGVTEVVMTTGLFDDVLMDYCKSLDLPLKINFVKNNEFKETNYIYSIYCAKDYLEDDIIMMHGDLVFENSVLDELISSEKSCMTVSSTLSLPKKDFKAVVIDGHITKVGIEFFNDAFAAQPLYKILKDDWKIWLDNIIAYCESGNRGCYAENAFNEVSDKCMIYPLDVKNQLCNEIDTPEDLLIITERVKNVMNRTVYMCFSTDMIHNGHIEIIKKARRLGKLIIGVLSDEAVVSYKRFPLIPFEDRKSMFQNIAGVYEVVEQKTLSYKENLEKYQPSFVVHGDDWRSGIQKPVRDEVVSTLAEYGGKLIEFPYTVDKTYLDLEKFARAELATPDARRSRLRKILNMKGTITAMEAHSGLTGLIVENTVVEEDGGARQFDAMWISSLCDSTAKGKPDIELVDMTSRFRTIDDVCEVTTKPIIFDGDTGGLTEHFVYTVRSLERMGVSMVIIEDKKGLKKNSLFGTEVKQTQATIEEFCEKIKAGKKAQRTEDFMICARIESLILEQGMEDALERAFAFSKAGADAIMIHSRKKDPSEIFEFVEKFREQNKETPVVVVPTSFNTVTEEEFKERGVNIIIYANQLTRTGFPAMQNAAKTILKNHRAKECDDMCMPFKDIIRLIPEDI
ncbi:MAG: phosphoenolpyruvate mutase [Lachnospiraceae bacterium]|nr:phosphoenolpyruvate mutase [Lachnospiraceae bacterium]